MSTSPEQERAQFFQERGWNWGFTSPVAPNPVKRRLFSSNEFQFLQPTIRREA